MTARKSWNARYFFVLLAVILFSGVSAFAQQNYGMIRGEVKDVQGASIPHATVTVTNQETKVSQSVMTNDSGVYTLPAVDPGTYKVTIAFVGFKTYDSTGNTVTLGATTTVDAALTVGATGETVEVAADTVALNTANATAEQVFTAQQIQDIPNLGRDPFMFAQLDANVVTLGDPRYVRAEDSSGISDVSLGGAPGNTNTYVVDGIPVSTSSGGATFVVSPEAIAEVKIQSDTFDAQIARTGGGVFNNTIKVGSAAYHGSLYGETRQTAWSANTWFNFANSSGVKAPTPTDETYLYSGAFGGPLVPPSMKDKAPKWLDKTFYWLTEEGYRQGQPTTGTNSYYVPTAAERLGDFSADLPLYDPTVASATAARTVTFMSECGNKNVIPGSPAATAYGVTCGGLNLFNGTGFAIANSFNQPQGSYATLPYGSGQPNFTVSGLGFKTRADEYIGKLEHTFFPWWTAQISYLHSAVQEPQTTPANEVNVFTSGADKEDRKFDSTAFNNTFTINSSTLLTVGFGFNRYFSAFPYYSQGFNLASGFSYGGTSYGFGTAFASNIPLPSFPTITLSGTNNGSASTSLGGAYGGPTPQASHNLVTVLSKTIRKHDLRFGYSYRGFSYLTNPPSTPGNFTFNGQYTTSTGAGSSSGAASNGTDAIADLELGLPSAATETLYAGPFVNRISYNGVFVQDDFRLTQKLTFNAGLRYDYEIGQHEVNNKFNVGFSQTLSTPYVNNAGATVNALGGYLFAGVNGNATHCCGNSHTKFSPRVGVAYQMAKDTVVHAGYGFFYAPIGITTTYNQGYSQITSPNIIAPNASAGITAVTANQVGANACLSNPYYGTNTTCAGTLLQPSANTLGGLTGVGGNVAAFGTGRKDPLVQQYLLDIQQKLPGDVILTVSYIGTHSSNFALPVNINQLSDANLAAAYTGNVKLSTSTATNPYYAKTIGGLPTTGVVASPTIATSQLQLPFPAYGLVTLTTSAGFGWYNSIAFKAEKRMSSGLTLLATYTHAANWDNIYSGIGSQSPTAATSGPQNYNNLGAEYSRSEDNIANRGTLAITDFLPVGKGKKYLGNPQGFTGKVLDAVVGGWEVNYTQIVASGIPLTVTQLTNQTALFAPSNGTVGGSVQRPSVLGDIHDACLAGKPQRRLGSFGGPVKETPYLNITAFTATQPYQYGNAPRTLPCRAPGFDTATASLSKYIFSYHDRVKVQFRIEALNLWNTPQFGAPSTALSVNNATNYGAQATAAQLATIVAPGVPSATSFNAAGSITSQAGFSRVIQMGGKITF